MSVTEAKSYLAPVPTKMTLFLRSFLPWQILRFLIINLRMTVMIAKSHGRHLETKRPVDQKSTSPS
ncbi:MAG: hypothetical protein A2622_09440 [Bdellovibrionales bacterium RIFCSPHIGHO2_01_FULL_40_29]|nr:MAG: hypothetical protein A2622_09440 [Bdellovibrionales bacterium RIFCSPHIGHO2_01_FULL_40_29]OFZ33554.1 MAG: hypothetical protein A3D17_00180 [Bdellovibrionales bacterium RIFCSPHIGHO2_02_FULL_40_15]